MNNPEFLRNQGGGQGISLPIVSNSIQTGGSFNYSNENEQRLQNPLTTQYPSSYPFEMVVSNVAQPEPDSSTITTQYLESIQRSLEFSANMYIDNPDITQQPISRETTDVLSYVQSVNIPIQSSTNPSMCSNLSFCPPKRPCTAYNYFLQNYYKEHTEEKAKNSIGTAVEKWKSLSIEEKELFFKEQEEDIKRFEKEKADYEKTFLNHNLPFMYSKRDKQTYFYKYVTTDDAKNLASFLRLFYNDDNQRVMDFLKTVLERLCDHTNEWNTASIAPPIEALPKQVMEFRCPFKGCDKVMTTEAGLKKHKQTHEENAPIYNCPLCEKTYKSKEGLDLHFQNHHDESKKKHICKICNMRFARRNDLKLHINRIHDKIKTFHCDFEGCGKSFFTSSELNRHRHIHTNLIVCYKK